MDEPDKKKILVTPLNWGLGHATRCIPIIYLLISQGFEPIIASDGNALLLLQKEFPKLKFYVLPSYNITYPKHSIFFIWHFVFKLLLFIKTYKAEQKTITKIVNKEKLSGIISDNRFGCFHPDVKSVYITHQLKVLSGLFTFITSKIHQNIIKHFDECWIPDKSNNFLSGKLSKVKLTSIKIKYIGILSRFKPINTKTKYDFLILLSGIETQRKKMENILRNAFKNNSLKVLFITGKLAKKQTKISKNGLTILNYATTKELQKFIAQSKVIIARSGYSTVMDLAAMGKKAFFIPTPGQKEQIYLAKLLAKKKVAPFSWQEQFKISHLSRLKDYDGFKNINPSNILLNSCLSRLT